MRRNTMSFYFFSVLALSKVASEATGNDNKPPQGCVVTDFNKVPDAVKNCTNIVLDSIQVPAGQTLKLHLNDYSLVTFKGETVFGYAPWEGPLVEINGTNVLIRGEEGAILNGQGKLYWDGKGEWGSLKPKFFTIQLHNSVMKNVYVLNSPIHCVLLADSTDVLLSNWIIDNKAGYPEVAGKEKSGHNTDGVDVWNGTNIVVTDSQVYNQDDCVAIRCGDRISISNMLCIGGHGLSVSVGFSKDSIAQNTLSNVIIADSVLKGGRNGIHIKNHVDGGSGLITNVTYKNIVFSEAANYGINIQQDYKNAISTTLRREPTNNILFRNFTFDNITGSVITSKAVPIYINCAKDGCFDWSFTDVNVTGDGCKKNFCNFEPFNFKC